MSKTALNHLIRELAVGLGPLVRVNGIAPATVVAGSTMFPRDRVMHRCRKYKIEFSESESTEDLRTKLAEFYAQRTLTRKPILPEDCADADCVAGERRKRENHRPHYSGRWRIAARRFCARSLLKTLRYYQPQAKTPTPQQASA